MNELVELLQKRLVVLPVWGWLVLGAHQLWRRMAALPQPAPIARLQWGPKPLEYPVRYPQRWKIAGTGGDTVVRFLGELLGVTLEEVEALLTKYFLLAGRAVGQVGIGSTAAKGNLTLESTSNAEKGSVLFGLVAAINEANTRLGIGTTAPASTLEVKPPALAAIATSPGTAAVKGLTVLGGTGGNTTIATKGQGGAGSSINLSAGPGGEAPNALEESNGGNGGSVTFSGAGGAPATVIGGTVNKGGKGGGFEFSSGKGGEAANGATSNVGGEGGQVRLIAGKGGNSSTTTAGKGGNLILQCLEGGLVAAGSPSTAGQMKFEGGSAKGTGLGTSFTFTCGLGGTEGTGGEFVIESGKEARTKKLQISQTGIGLFGAAPVAQATAITKVAKKEGEAGVTAEIIEKLNQVIKALAAAEGGIGVTA